MTWHPISTALKQMTKKAPIPADLLIRQFPTRAINRE